MDVEIKPVERIFGEIDLPGDKSISHRAVMIGSISEGETAASNFLTGEDCLSTIEAFRQMGIKIDLEGKKIKVTGKGLRGLAKPAKELYLGNSGTTMRLISGILAGQNFEATLTGDESLSKRPMKRIIEPLSLMGADISSLNNNGCAPLKIKGKKLKSISYKTKVASAQVKSCILFAGLYGNGITEVEEPFISRDHTERMLKHFGAVLKQDKARVHINSGSVLKGKKIIIPGDISSAAFFIAQALILEGSELTVRSVGFNPTRIKLIDVLMRMGAKIDVEKINREFEPACDLKVKASNLRGINIKEEEIPGIIDEIPILCVAAAKAEGVTEIRGVQELRVKETDRVDSMVKNLRKVGVDIKANGNNLIIRGSKKRFSLKKNVLLDSFGDHRTAMAMCVALSASDSKGVVQNINCVNTSFPTFFDIFNYIKR